MTALRGRSGKAFARVKVFKRKGTSAGASRRGRETCFDHYEFADYSGASDSDQQRRVIKVGGSEGSSEPELLNISVTRRGLLLRFVETLRAATRKGKRMILGQDHQYSIPYGLAQEIGLDLEWRKGLKMLIEGTYAPDAPWLEHPKNYARRFNDWLMSHGMRPYFYSATKAGLYGIPNRDPRGSGDPTMYRLTERYPSIFGTGNLSPSIGGR